MFSLSVLVSIELQSISVSDVVPLFCSDHLFPRSTTPFSGSTGHALCRRKHSPSVLRDHFSFTSQHMAQTLIQCMGYCFVTYGSFFGYLIRNVYLSLCYLPGLYFLLPYCSATLISLHEGSQNDHQPVYMCLHASLGVGVCASHISCMSKHMLCLILCQHQKYVYMIGSDW